MKNGNECCFEWLKEIGLELESTALHWLMFSIYFIDLECYNLNCISQILKTNKATAVCCIRLFLQGNLVANFSLPASYSQVLTPFFQIADSFISTLISGDWEESEATRCNKGHVVDLSEQYRTWAVKIGVAGAWSWPCAWLQLKDELTWSSAKCYCLNIYT